MRILLFSYYFPPDLSACSFRMSGLVEALNDNTEVELVTVLTTTPHRYEAYRPETVGTILNGKVRVIRFDCRSKFGGMVGQIISCLFYWANILKYIFKEDIRYDVMFSTSSRLMTGVIGAYVSKRFKIPLLLDIRDLFLDVLTEVHPKLYLLSRFILQRLELYALNQAEAISIVSPAFEAYITRLVPGKVIKFYPNGVDKVFETTLPLQPYNKDRTLKILYAGNIGAGQGLHNIVPGLAKEMSAQFQFNIVGDGASRKKLELAVQGIKNVYIHSPVRRLDLLEFYKNADVLFLHLNNFLAFDKVIPSKLFEYAATGKPILFGANGMAAEFARNEIDNVAVFEPCNVNAAKDAIGTLAFEVTSRLDFVEKYSRKSISTALANEICRLSR